jgi:hypothetical protein
MGQFFFSDSSKEKRKVSCCVIVVVNKCANDACTNPFLYLKSGRLFHFPKSPSRQVQTVRQMEAFWLCDRCSQKLTLKRTGDRVVAIPKQHS